MDGSLHGSCDMHQRGPSTSALCFRAGLVCIAAYASIRRAQGRPAAPPGLKDESTGLCWCGGSAAWTVDAPASSVVGAALIVARETSLECDRDIANHAHTSRIKVLTAPRVQSAEVYYDLHALPGEDVQNRNDNITE